MSGPARTSLRFHCRTLAIAKGGSVAPHESAEDTEARFTETIMSSKTSSNREARHSEK